MFLKTKWRKTEFANKYLGRLKTISVTLKVLICKGSQEKFTSFMNRKTKGLSQLFSYLADANRTVIFILSTMKSMTNTDQVSQEFPTIDMVY